MSEAYFYSSNLKIRDDLVFDIMDMRKVNKLEMLTDYCRLVFDDYKNQTFHFLVRNDKVSHKDLLKELELVKELDGNYKEISNEEVLELIEKEIECP
jgi:hypothetical protein